MRAPTEQQLAWLVAREEIRDVIGRYALAGDRRNDPGIMRDVFTQDAVWEAEGFGRFEGRDTIVSELARIGQEQIIWSLHFPVAPLLDLGSDGATAHAFWWLWELLTMRDGDREANKWIGANYDCDFVREADGWKMHHLVLRIRKMVESGEGPNEIPNPPEAGE